MVFQRYKSEISKHHLFWKEPPESVNLLSEKKLNNSKINCVHCNDLKTSNSMKTRLSLSSNQAALPIVLKAMYHEWICSDLKDVQKKYMVLKIYGNYTIYKHFFLCHINILIYFYCVLHTFWFIKFVCSTFKYFTYLLQNTFNCLITLIKFDGFFHIIEIDKVFLYLSHI